MCVGVFVVTTLTADEMKGLLYQLIFCIGTQPDIIYSDTHRKRLVNFLWMLMTTIDLLWCIYGHSELQLRSIHLRVIIFCIAERGATWWSLARRRRREGLAGIRNKKAPPARLTVYCAHLLERACARNRGSLARAKETVK
jgi:hypothetical protein